MTILVTGGAGFIGSHLIQALQANGHAIVNVDEVNDYYNPAFKRYNLAQLAPHDFYQVSINQEGQLKEIFAKHHPEIVVHLGARAGVRPSMAEPELYRQVNYEGTKGLAELAARYGVRQFVFGSTSAVYGNSLSPFSETITDLKPISPYAQFKWMAEKFLNDAQKSSGMKTTVLRFFTVYGERGRPDMAPYLFTEAVLRGQPIQKFGDGSSSRDYTYIQDIIAGILAAIARPFEFEIINLGNHQAISLNTFIQTLEAITGKTAQLVPMPPQAGDVNHTLADISKAQQLLGYQPTTSLPDGLEKFVRWFKDHRL